MNLRLYMTFALLEHDGGGRFRAVGAHLPALIYRAAKKSVEEIEIGGVWLGVIDQITPDLVPETDFELARGDTMLLLTDGVVEHTGPTGMCGFDRVHAELAAHADRGPSQVLEAVTAPRGPRRHPGRRRHPARPQLRRRARRHPGLLKRTPMDPISGLLRVPPA